MAVELGTDCALENEVSEALAGQWTVAVATTGCPVDALTAGERRQYAGLPPVGPRRLSWLLGRAALHRLLTRLGQPADTAALRFPHPRLSLSHTGGVAVAATPVALAAAGVGIDIEMLRQPREALARFFLDPAECAWLAAQPAPERPAHLLRLWTVKEAVFKANPANRSTALHQYQLADCAAVRGIAVLHPDCTFDYRSADVDGHLVSVATCRKPTIRIALGKGSPWSARPQ